MSHATDFDRLQAVVQDALAVENPDVKIGPDSDMAAAGLTSLGIVFIVTGIESEFGLTLPYDELDYGWFTTPRELWAQLEPTVTVGGRARDGRA